MYQWCKSRDFKPMLHLMDNETSKEIEDFIHSQQTGLQYPCCNMPTKKPLQASRKNSSHLQSLFQINHSVVSIPEFPTSHWCKLINQVDFAVNIVRPCRQKPNFQCGQHAMEASILIQLQLHHPEQPCLCMPSLKTEVLLVSMQRRHIILVHVSNVTEHSENSCL